MDGVADDSLGGIGLNVPAAPTSAGKFITFEGGEGVGKSTQLKRLTAALDAAGKRCIATREPGGAPAAEEIRRLLVEGAVERWQPMSEVLLHNAARIEHLAATVRPALKSGTWVICDRFTDSTLAYQGYGHGVDAATIANLHWLLYKDFKPDLTLILDMDLDQGLNRAGGRADGEDRYERMGRDFHERLRAGFLEIAKAEPGRCAVIDADGDVETVHGRIMAAVCDRLQIL